MISNRIRLCGAPPTNGSCVISRLRISGLWLNFLLGSVALSIVSVNALAQHGGGGRGGAMAGGSGVGVGRPDGVSEKDDLKDFHRVMALQATDEQRSAFIKIAEYSQTAIDQLKSFRESLPKSVADPPLPDREAAVDQAIAKARAGNQNFLTSFTPAQKSGLKDLANRLAKADTELDKQIKGLNQIVQTTTEAERIADATTGIEKDLASFQSEQLAMGREMGILLSNDTQILTFNLPNSTNSIKVGGQAISVPASEVASRTSIENGRNIFSLKLVADFTELQQNITAILRSELNRAPRCGEQIEIQQAALTPLDPASRVAAHFHYQRFICPPGQSPMEVADGDAAIEITLTPSIDKTGTLSLSSETTRVDAEGFLRDLLRSGDLGTMIRKRVSDVMLSTLQKTADLKASLPAVGQQSATLQRAEFQNRGTDQLNLIVEGQLNFSEEQTKIFAAQLKQPLSAQGTPSP